MKRMLLCMALLAVGFASCKKDDDDDNGPDKSSYYITGISDRTIQKSVMGVPGNVSMGLSLVYEHSEQERVTLSVENLPEGLKHRFTTKSGVPSFNSTLQLTDSGAAEGEYVVKLVATGSNSGRRTYDFNVSIQGAPDCSGEVTGIGYSSNTNCGSSGTFIQNVSAVAGQPSRVVFSNLDNTGNEVYGLVLCGTSQITIPNQVVNGVTYQGNASYGTSGTQRVLNVNFMRIQGGNQFNCNVQMRL